jgi:hypothetical protein
LHAGSYQNASLLNDIEILIGLSDPRTRVRPEEFVAEDLGEEDVVGPVVGFEAVATEGAVGGAEVAGFKGWSRAPKVAETYFGAWRQIVPTTSIIRTRAPSGPNLLRDFKTVDL